MHTNTILLTPLHLPILLIVLTTGGTPLTAVHRLKKRLERGTVKSIGEKRRGRFSPDILTQGGVVPLLILFSPPRGGGG